jgi:nitrate reductase beta subunit
VRNRRGRLTLKAGGRFKKLLTIFANPVLPNIRDYYEPWTYDYEKLTDAPLGDDFPVAQPKVAALGRADGDRVERELGRRPRRRPEHGPRDPIVERLRRESEDAVRFSYEQAFMFFLPRICEHCLNPSVRGVVPVGGDVQARRGRHRAGRPGPVPGLADVRHRLPVQEGVLQPPHRQGREVHVLLPAHRGRAAHRLLRDVRGAAALHRAVPLRRRPRHRGRVGGGRARPLRSPARAAARPERPGGDRAGPPRRHRRGLDLAAQRSPVYKLAKDYRVALPLHPEFRTMPMVWYIPPLSPVVDRLTETGHDGEDAGNLFGAIDALRIPVEYLAELFTAGDPNRCAACCRSWPRCGPTCVT